MSSVNAAMNVEPPALLRYFDVAVLVVAAPILLLIGVSPAGYGIGAGVWMALRAVGVGVERYASNVKDLSRSTGVRLGYMLGRLFGLAIAVVLVRKGYGQGAGLTCLVVVVAAFTVQLVLSAVTRPRSR
jgi:ABC-type transporter Mla maintaining outer membrane lipid asymmetry permease subunit MlaE